MRDVPLTWAGKAAQCKVPLFCGVMFGRGSHTMRLTSVSVIFQPCPYSYCKCILFLDSLLWFFAVMILCNNNFDRYIFKMENSNKVIMVSLK